MDLMEQLNDAHAALKRAFEGFEAAPTEWANRELRILMSEYSRVKRAVADLLEEARRC